MMVDMRQDLQETHVLPEQQWKAGRDVLVRLTTSHLYVAASETSAPKGVDFPSHRSLTPLTTTSA